MFKLIFNSGDVLYAEADRQHRASRSMTDTLGKFYTTAEMYRWLKVKDNEWHTWYIDGFWVRDIVKVSAEELASGTTV